MKSISPYLMFHGECRAAMEFYRRSLGGELEVMTYEGSEVPHTDEEKDFVMHATLVTGPLVIMGADHTGSKKPVSADTVHLSIDCESEEEINRLFGNMSAGGHISMPVEDTFWGARFGMCKDKFGINWMFNYDKPTPS